MKKYLLLLLMLTNCASLFPTKREQLKQDTLRCIKDLLDYNAPVKDAYDVCHQIEQN